MIVMDDNNNIISVRLATTEDFQTILDISEGIYDGENYIPVVLQEWLMDSSKLVFIAEYEGTAVGMQVAVISDDPFSFVTQSLRINPNYRGRKLSYKFQNAVIKKVCTMYPRVTKNLITCIKDTAAWRLFTNLGYRRIMQQSIHDIKKLFLPDIKLAEIPVPNLDLSLFSLDQQAAERLYSNKKVLHLVGPHGIVFAERFFPHKVPEGAHRVIMKTDRIFVDIPEERLCKEDEFPRSFSHGTLSKRVKKYFWLGCIYTSDPLLFKEHVICHLNEVVEVKDRRGNEVVVCFLQSSNSEFDGGKVIKEALSGLNIYNGEVTSSDVLVMEKDLGCK